MKTIDTQGYLNILCRIIEDGNTACTVVTGGSMSPFLASNRDYVYLEKPKRKLKKGDVVLFIRQNGDYVLHRIKRISTEGYYLTGDRQTTLEGPVKREQIMALVTSVKRKSKILTPKSLIWQFYEKIWINTVCIRPILFKLYSRF